MSGGKVSVAIVPARGGSLGIPGKNLCTLEGKSLVARAVEAARTSGRIGAVYLTTDSEEIAVEGRRHGALVISRPAALAGADTRMEDVVSHALDYFEAGGIEAESFILLQPTSPLRSAEDIQGACELFDGSGSVIGVCEPEKHPMKTFVLQANGGLTPFIDEKTLGTPRQQLPKLYSANGAIYLTGVAGFRTSGGFYSPPVRPFPMSRRNSIDIDDLDDLRLAEMYLRLDPVL